MTGQFIIRMLKPTFFPLLIFVIALSFIQCGILDPNDKSHIDIDAEIQAEMAALKIPSIVAGVIHHDEMVWLKSYGYKNREQRTIPTGNTLYTLMSVSKTVIATAVMQLWEQGKLDLDADINHYLPFAVRNPHFPDHKITARMLMTHTSGLVRTTYSLMPQWYFRHPDDQTPAMSSWIDQWLLPEGAHYSSIIWNAYAPGTREMYSNIGSWLLAYIVENISGEEYTAYCKSHIFQPLQMNNTGYWLADLDVSDIATPYDEKYLPIEQYNSLAYPVGWVRSSVNDFSHFLIAYMNNGVYNGNRILRASTVDKMLQVQNQASGICLTWYKWLGEWYGHDGGGTGFSSWVEFNPDDNIAVIILANLHLGSVDLVTPGGRIFELVRFQADLYR